MSLFHYYSLFYSIYLPLKEKKIILIHTSWILVTILVIISNFDTIRFANSTDKYGNTIVHDRFTGKKWKQR